MFEYSAQKKRETFNLSVGYPDGDFLNHLKYNYTPLLRIAYCISYKINYCISIPSIADYFPELFSDLEIN